MPKIQVDAPAPNFDLASTEDAILMLRDEVPRTPVLLYFFGEPDGAHGVLSALGAALPALAREGVRVLGVSPAKLEALKATQRELGLGFPLLSDDRNFSREYGVGEGGGLAASAFILVGRDERVRWYAAPAPAAEQAVTETLATLKGGASSTVNYPRAVINGWIDRWVN